MPAWAREEESAFENRQRKRAADEAHKVEVATGVTVASFLRRFRAALIGPAQRFLRRRRLCRCRTHTSSLDTLYIFIYIV